MVRQQQNAPSDVDEKYKTENQIVAHIKTVSKVAPKLAFRLANFGKYRVTCEDRP